jgi:LacI family transcriptional regulator
LRDVARAAGVSVASASRALARPEVVSAELRGRIGAAAERLGYVPNLAARRLAGSHSGLVGLLVSGSPDALAAAAVAAIDRQLGRVGYGLVVAHCDGATGALARAREMLGRGVDALLAWDPSGALPAIADCAARHSTPWLVLGEAEETRAPGSGAVGRRRGAALGCRYLQSLGHQRFAAVEARAPGVAHGLRDALGRRAKEAMVEPAPETGELPGALARMLDRRSPPTAVICGGDDRATAVLRACHAQGISVPGEVSVLGFGDSEAGRLAWPALSTVRVALDDVATGAAESLLSMLGGAAPGTIEGAVKLVVRESTAAPPS